MKEAKPQAVRPAGSGKPGGLNAEIQSRIGHQLRAMYDDVVRQGVPDRFADLIRKLDGPDSSASGTGDPSGQGGGAPHAAASSSNIAAKTDGRD
jgi:hypothetical protein